jgi:hypothetical protein
MGLRCLWAALLVALPCLDAFVPAARLLGAHRAGRQGLVMMGAKTVRFGDAGLDKLVQGVNIVANAVKVRPERAWGAPHRGP